jgi:RecB family exonuclease
VVIENVWEYRDFDSYRIIAGALTDLGYTTELHHVNAADFGVPQTRKRLILRAVREGALGPLTPTHDKNGAGGLPRWIGWYAAIEDLIPDLPESELANWQKERLGPLLEELRNSAFFGPNGERYHPRYAEEPVGTISSNHSLGKYRAVLVEGDAAGARPPTTLEAGEPCFTLKTAGGGRVHRALLPTRTVEMSVPALARFQSVPDDYARYLAGFTKKLACTIIGNGVPCTLAQRVVESLDPECGDSDSTRKTIHIMPRKTASQPLPTVDPIEPASEPGVTVTVEGKEFHLGYSRIAKYMECPKAYKFSYIDKLSFAPGEPIRKGLAYHAVVEALLDYKVKRGKLYKLANTLKYAEERATVYKLTKSGTASLISAVAFYHATLYAEHDPVAYERQNADGETEIHSWQEKDFEIHRGGVKLTGRIDLIENCGRIIDHKFSFDIWNVERAKYGVQPMVYQWAAQDQLEKEKPDWKYSGFEYQVIRSHPCPVIQRLEIGLLSQSVSDWWEEQIAQIAAAIKAGLFPANATEKSCKYCQYKETCQPAIYKLKERQITETDDDANVGPTF